jgi:hypothetical protein
VAERLTGKLLWKEYVVNRARLNYWLDAAIGVAFLFSAISGLVFLLPVGSSSGSGILGLSYQAWDDLHTWSSLAMIAGVLVHLVLHWRWIASMTRRVLAKPTRASRPVRTETVPEVVWIKSGRRNMNRRDFLRLSGVAVVGAGLGVLGYRAIGTAGPTDAVQEAEQDRVVSPAVDRPSLQEAETEELQLLPTPTRQVPPPAAPTEAPQQVCVACPRGLVNDPYPGQCRRYIDANDNGICDLSESGSGNNCL